MADTEKPAWNKVKNTPHSNVDMWRRQIPMIAILHAEGSVHQNAEGLPYEDSASAFPPLLSGVNEPLDTADEMC